MAVLKKINHVGIAVKDLKDAAQKYAMLSKEDDYETEYVEGQDVDVAMFHVGESKVELLQGRTENSPISKFLEKNREGLHHICYEVENLEETLAELEKEGFRLIDTKPRIGAGGHRIAFVHPKSTAGVLTELLEKK